MITTPFLQLRLTYYVQHKINLQLVLAYYGRIQLSQMSVAKLTTRFRLQAYLGLIIMIMRTKLYRFCNWLVMKIRIAYITSIGRRERSHRSFITIWLLREQIYKILNCL